MEFRAPPHQDDDLHRYPWAGSQLGISLGLVSPNGGGEIRLWDLAYGKAEYAELALSDPRVLDEEKIPEHNAKIRGEVGELLVVDARRIHAIDRITEGKRLSVSGFLAVDGPRTWIWS
jgi:hypothetical protein